jgi:hypothetical protein
MLASRVAASILVLELPVPSANQTSSAPKVMSVSSLPTRIVLPRECHPPAAELLLDPEAGDLGADARIFGHREALYTPRKGMGLRLPVRPLRHLVLVVGWFRPARQQPVARDERFGDVHDLLVRTPRLLADHVEGLLLVEGMSFHQDPFARSVTARLVNAPSRAWCSAKRWSAMSIELCSSARSSR